MKNTAKANFPVAFPGAPPEGEDLDEWWAKERKALVSLLNAHFDEKPPDREIVAFLSMAQSISLVDSAVNTIDHVREMVPEEVTDLLMAATVYLWRFSAGMTATLDTLLDRVQEEG